MFYDPRLRVRYDADFVSVAQYLFGAAVDGVFGLFYYRSLLGKIDGVNSDRALKCLCSFSPYVLWAHAVSVLLTLLIVRSWRCWRIHSGFPDVSFCSLTLIWD